MIVDEADLVLSYGYANDIKSLVEKLPKTCQSLLMSATLSDDLEKLKKVVLRSPVILRLEMGKRDGQLRQFYLSIPRDDKDLLLYAFIKLGVITGKALFFVNDVETCYRKKLIMEQFGIHAAVLNSELPFNSRQHIIKEFNKGVFDILIATDDSLGIQDGDLDSSSENDDGDSSDEENDNTSLSRRSGVKNDKEYGVSRGVDFYGVTFVLNIDFPKTPEAYTHRIGRTARGGASGTAISFVEDGNTEEHAVLKLIQEEQPRLPGKGSGTQNGEEGVLQGKDEELQHQPAFFDFKIADLEGFRYRMDDVKRAVTKVAVRDARVRELKQEMINSERLKDHFKENPQDLQILQHAGSLRPHLIKKHLAHVPDYLLPADMKPKKTLLAIKGSANGRKQVTLAIIQVHRSVRVKIPSLILCSPLHMNPSMATTWMILAVMKRNSQKGQLQANLKLLVGTRSGRGGMEKGSFLKSMIETVGERSGRESIKVFRQLSKSQVCVKSGTNK